MHQPPAGPGVLKWHIQPSDAHFGVNVHLMFQSDSGAQYLYRPKNGGKGEWVEHKKGSIVPKFCVISDLSDVRGLRDALDNHLRGYYGGRHKTVDRVEGELEATSHHLGDMRALAAKALKVKLLAKTENGT